MVLAAMDGLTSLTTVEQIGGISGDDFSRMNVALARLERFWTDQIRYRL